MTSHGPLEFAQLSGGPLDGLTRTIPDGMLICQFFHMNELDPLADNLVTYRSTEDRNEKGYRICVFAPSDSERLRHSASVSAPL